MPPRVSFSVQGTLPGEPGTRFFTSQAFVAEPRSTRRSPFGVMAKGCIWVVPVTGRPETTTSPEDLGATSPVFSG
ncbi:hypothetical protein ACU4GA_30310 [Methylobacterium oryzae CBMB20]